MKITVFGGTGRTGLELLRQATAAGHEVTAVVRDPGKVPAELAGVLQVVPANAADAAEIAPAIAGRDVVVTAIGSTSLRPTTVQTDTTAAIMAAMTETGVRRLLMISNGGMTTEGVPAFERIVIRPIVGRVLRHPWGDMRRTEELIRHSGLQWTIVRPPRLTNAALRTDYRVVRDRSAGGKGSIARASLADYLLRAAADDSTVHAAMAISD